MKHKSSRSMELERRYLPPCRLAAERTTNGTVVMPNPFYQIYEGAAFMAGLTPHYLPITESGQPDYYAVPDAIWKDCQFCFICTPGNPTGTVIDEAMLTYLIGKAQMFDFWLASDECYSEIYRANVPPSGLLEVCSTIGNTDFKKCMVFHSPIKTFKLTGSSIRLCGWRRRLYQTLFKVQNLSRLLDVDGRTKSVGTCMGR